MVGSLPAPRFPQGVLLRAFRDDDQDEWLELNARAFANLPDQGSWTARELRQRFAEPWFDPDGFVLAIGSQSSILGYCWTKVDRSQTLDRPLGEIFVIGVDPTARGLGLGRALVLAALQDLQASGLETATLHVDATNEAALKMYRSLGFLDYDYDTLFVKR